MRGWLSSAPRLGLDQGIRQRRLGEATACHGRLTPGKVLLNHRFGSFAKLSNVALPLPTGSELADAKHNFAEAKASLACEGVYLTAAEEALFARFEAERLPHVELRRQLVEYSRNNRST